MTCYDWSLGHSAIILKEDLLTLSLLLVSSYHVYLIGLMLLNTTSYFRLPLKALRVSEFSMHTSTKGCFNCQFPSLIAVTPRTQIGSKVASFDFDSYSKERKSSNAQFRLIHSLNYGYQPAKAVKSTKRSLTKTISFRKRKQLCIFGIKWGYACEMREPKQGWWLQDTC